MNAFLEIKDLRVSRGEFSLHVPTLTVQKGEIHLLMGPSGSGKSTVLQAIGGFIEGVSGEIWVAGKEISSLPPENRAVGYVFQKNALFPNMNVWENVAFALKVRGVSKKDQELRALEWLNRVGLAGHAKKTVDQLSGGEAQRVQLARALIADFPVLLLDEPFSALDAPLKADLRILLKKLVRETSVACLMVSHDPADVESVAELCTSIEKGKITKTERVRSV